MTRAEKPLVIDHAQQSATSVFLPRPPVLSSHQSGWENIHLVHYQLPALEIPEIASSQHTIVLPSYRQSTKVELVAEGRCHLTQHHKDEVDRIVILPSDLPIKSKWSEESDFIHCYLDPTFLAHAAYESVNPDRVEVNLTLATPDPLVWQIGFALKSVLETDGRNSCFYAESMATALAAHVLKYYSTRKHILREYEGGLPKHKLKQAIDYINAHLMEDISLSSISNQLGMSQCYFCRLFKQSTGITPHAYLIQQRVELSKLLLKQLDRTITSVGLECGFANHSHFAKHFRQHTGISPKQFRDEKNSKILFK